MAGMLQISAQRCGVPALDRRDASGGLFGRELAAEAVVTVHAGAGEKRSGERLLMAG